jgi:hypothetical protein
VDGCSLIRDDALVHRWLDPGAGEDLERWNALLQRTRHDFHQLPEYVTLEAERAGGQGLALLVEDPKAPERAALLPLILRPLPGREGVDATSPYGYPGPVFTGGDASGHFEAGAVAAFVAAMAARGVASAFVRLHPLLPTPAPALARVGSLVEHGPTVWIDLQADEDTQWADYRGTHRNLIRRAKREGQRVSFDDAFTRLDDFYPIYAQTMARGGGDRRRRVLELHWHRPVSPLGHGHGLATRLAEPVAARRSPATSGRPR